jgi:ABC-type microcin C transport system duplicated ATPase subunit YejF
VKYLRKIFESNEDDKRYIEECFLDISENQNFEVDDLLEVESSQKSYKLQYYDSTGKKISVPMVVYKLHIELGKDLSLHPVGNPYSGKVETSLTFLRMKNEKLTELYDDIEVAIKRIKDKFEYKCDVKIKSNRREEIDITILIAKN